MRNCHHARHHHATLLPPSAASATKHWASSLANHRATRRSHTRGPICRPPLRTIPQGEARNLEEIYANVMPLWGDEVVIPLPITELCTKEVLVMEYLPGPTLIKGIRASYRTPPASYPRQGHPRLVPPVARLVTRRSHLSSNRRSPGHETRDGYT